MASATLQDRHYQMTEDASEHLRPPMPRGVSSSTSTKALQEMYRKSQGTAFFATVGPVNQFGQFDEFGAVPQPSPSLRGDRKMSRLGADLYHADRMSVVGSDKFEVKSVLILASQHSRPVSTMSGTRKRQTLKHAPSFDNQPATLAGLDLTDPWGFSWTSDSPCKIVFDVFQQCSSAQ